MSKSGPLDHVLTEGVVLINRYELRRMVGEGGMGVVWQGLDRTLGASVAIKFLKALDEGSRKRFAEESRTAARLSSPHVVKVFDVGTYEGFPFLVMEYLEGQTLRECVLVRGRLEPETVVSIIEQVADGLSQAHEQGIVHRDIKPANIFLVRREGGPFAKILDFGVAKTQSLEWTETGGWLGSVHYASPEQAADASCATASADNWALAVIAYETLTGRKPFDSVSAAGVVAAVLRAEFIAPSLLEASLPKELDVWMRDALDRDCSRRPSSVRRLATSLRKALSVETALLREGVTGSTASTLELVPRTRGGAWRTALVACCSALIGATSHWATSCSFDTVEASAKESRSLLTTTHQERSLAVPCQMPREPQPETRPMHEGMSTERPSHSALSTQTPKLTGTPLNPSSKSAKARLESGPANNPTPQAVTPSPSEETLWRKRR